MLTLRQMRVKGYTLYPIAIVRTVPRVAPVADRADEARRETERLTPFPFHRAQLIALPAPRHDQRKLHTEEEISNVLVVEKSGSGATAS